MACNPRYQILFEPVKIGPVTAKNRFYQVPHCTGMGYAMPHSLARLREVKAEGGWGVVCTEYCSIHPSSDDSYCAYATLWDDDDIRSHSLMTEAVHRHGALAGVELWHGGRHVVNRSTRQMPLSPSGGVIHYLNPVQTHAMDKSDIRELRRWQVDAAKRAKQAGFDIVYVYAGHGYLPFQFIGRRYNHRSDEYGGSLENRVRLLREMIEDTKEAVGDTCAVAVRFAVDELIGPAGITSDGEGREVIELLAELPDLWDVNLSDTENDSGSSRFTPEAGQEPYVNWVKQVTSKPVVGVGRFTSPDTMVSQIRRGILDFIGAARPSIADPFLPRKIEMGQEDDIRECIGCNICRSNNNEGVPIRCTQNPTTGEEWRRTWHPENVPQKRSHDSVLIVGAGPAGLECARVLGRRGYEVHLAEATTELGGRLVGETGLPNLSVWGRVRDYRIHQLEKLHNVQIYRDSRLSADDVLGFGFDHIVVATGARWRKDGVGRANLLSVPGWERQSVFAPEDIMADAVVSGPAVVYDDDHYYMGACLAEKLRQQVESVTLVTPAAEAGTWSRSTDEQVFVQARLLNLGIEIATARRVTAYDGDFVELACVYTDRRTRIPGTSLVMVTERVPNDALYKDLMQSPQRLADAGIKSVTLIGDAYAPAIIANAVYSGFEFGHEFQSPPFGDVPFRRERVTVA